MVSIVSFVFGGCFGVPFSQEQYKYKPNFYKEKVGKHRDPEVSVLPHPKIELSCSFHCPSSVKSLQVPRFSCQMMLSWWTRGQQFVPPRTTLWPFVPNVCSDV